jgi:hypothetical protein
MFLIFLLISIGLLVVNLAGLTMLLGRWLPYPIARASGMLLLALCLFFVEHFFGLGKINWLWPISSIGAGAILFIHRKELASREFRASELVFMLALLYGLFWKFLIPDIYPSSERVTDMYFMANYFDGHTLPPPDHWYAGHRFDFYYAFQHYSASLLGRWFGWELGVALNLGFVLLMALGLSLAWDFAARFVPSMANRLVLILALALGGTGVSPLLDLFVAEAPTSAPANQSLERMWASARFIGSYDSRINTDLGLKLMPPITPGSGLAVRELPLENFGYQYFLGDYHPPLGGFFLLFLMLALIGWGQQTSGGVGNAQSTGTVRGAPQANPDLWQFLLTLCVPVMLVTNTWILPMQAILVVSFIAWRWWRKEPLQWLALLGGGVVGFMLIYPFLTHFATHALQTPIRWVSGRNHTELVRYLVVMWPLLALFGLALFDARKRPLVLLFIASFAVMMLVGELTWVDDPSADLYERTNTTMKWWGWMWSGALLSCGAMALSSSRILLRWSALLVLFACSFYLLPTLRFWQTTVPSTFGRLEGSAWFTKDVPIAAAVNYLKDAPRGIVLENWLGDAYTNQTLFALYSNQPSLMGWPAHLGVWHNNSPDTWLMRQQFIDFYKGTMPDALGWLLQHNVRYVVWGHTERYATNWQQMHDTLAGRYDWQPFVNSANDHVGVWVRR